jgi:HEAT repeat protein
MTTNSHSDAVHHRDDSQRGAGLAQFSVRRGIPRWITVPICCMLAGGACLRLYDYQHPAAWAARQLWSPRLSDRISAIRELEGSGRVDTEVSVPALIRALTDTDAGVRAGAAMALVSAVPGVAGGQPPNTTELRTVLNALVKALNEQEPVVRATFTRALWMVMLVNQGRASQIDLEPASDALISRLDDPDPAVRLSAIQGLGSIGPMVLGDPPPRLVAALDEKSEKNRAAAVEALAVFYRGLPPLLPSLAQSADRAAAPARADYLKLLNRVRPPKFSGDAVPGLIAALASENAEIVSVAASDLIAFQDAVRRGEPSPASSAVRPLMVAIDRLIETKSHDASTADPVVAIAAALGRLAPESPLCDKAVASLVKLLRVGNTSRRVAAVTALGGFRPTSSLTAAVLPDLVEAIASPDPATQVAAFQMLGSLKAAAAPATPDLVKMMKEARDKNDDSRVFRCADVLLGIGSEEASKEAIGTLRIMAEHGSASSRIVATNALNKLKVAQ